MGAVVLIEPLILNIIFGVLLIATSVYCWLCLYAAADWRRKAGDVVTDYPTVTLFKPICGEDPELLDNLRSFCHQDYPRFQILIGALDEDDPGLKATRQLQSECPELDLKIISGRPPTGYNLKVSTLAMMSPFATGDIWVLSDSDMRAKPNYLSRVTAPFRDPAVGLVTCPYRGIKASGIASRLEALGVGADFVPSVLLTRKTRGMSFAFGSTIAIRRAVMDEIGGFSVIADVLADDYWLGRHTADLGRRVVLSNYEMDCVLGRERLKAMLARRLRWAKTVRACLPAGYAGLAITYSIAIALLTLLIHPTAIILWLATIAMLSRIVTAGMISLFATKDFTVIRNLWLLPINDLLSLVIWVLSFFGHTISWRGQRFYLSKDGRLQPIRSSNREKTAL